jgi:pectin methylesterase-like acyl-CoA thioesterase
MLRNKKLALILAITLAAQTSGSFIYSQKVEAANQNSSVIDTATNSQTTIFVDGNKPTDIAQNRYKTISEAVTAAPRVNDESKRVTIKIADGTYREQIIVNKPYITFKSASGNPSKVILTWYYGIGYVYNNIGTNGFYDANVNWSADSTWKGLTKHKAGDAISTVTYYDKSGQLHKDETVKGGVLGKPDRWGCGTKVNKEADHFIADGVTFNSSFNFYVTKEEIAAGVLPETQAKPKPDRASLGAGSTEVEKSSYVERATALHTDSDHTIVKNCVIKSKQDSLYAGSNRILFDKCEIEGGTDYIFGAATAVFNNCNLVFAGNSDNTASGVVTAASTKSATQYGYLFWNCNIDYRLRGEKTPEAGTFGRPWSDPLGAQVTFYNTTVKKVNGVPVISDIGWRDMNVKMTDARFYEYGTKDESGNPLDTSKRPVNALDTMGVVLDKWQILEFNPRNYLKGTDGWDPMDFAKNYDDINNILNSTNININKEGGKASLPSAPKGYEFSWTSNSKDAVISDDKSSINIAKTYEANATITLYVRNLNTGYGDRKTIPLQSQGTKDSKILSSKFNFTSKAKDGYTSVAYNASKGIPVYGYSNVYGFVNKTNAFPAREVHTSQIVSTANGFEITEQKFDVNEKDPKNSYNNYGMDFRIKAPVGAYKVYVKTTSDAKDTTVAISGMNTSKLLKEGSWDKAGLVPIKNIVSAKGNEWSFNYVNGQEYIDIEIEPNNLNVPVGIQEIVLEPIAPEKNNYGSRPTIFTLGDSTVTSYNFDEAPMSSWGELLDNMFDLKKVNVINYSMGGRSLKNMYFEGRLNDILLTGKLGDYVLVQSGHNDESTDENTRWGRGATEETYEAYLRNVFVPDIKSRGMIPVFVTPMSRIKSDAKSGYIYANSFTKRKFPDVMKKVGADMGVSIIDLNSESVKYYNELGVEGTTAVFMSIEAGETPGKTNEGSYANGHPAKKIDGTHYKEALGKQFARIVVTEFSKRANEGNNDAARVVSYMKNNIQDAIKSGNWGKIFPEISEDVVKGEGAYYRNQIEKLVELGVFSKDANGNFNPKNKITVKEYTAAIKRVMKLSGNALSNYDYSGTLTREIMGSILDDAYHSKFSEKPKYMTDYNGKTVLPGDPSYDPNLDSGAKGAMYYPTISYEQLKDTRSISTQYVDKVKDAYNLGLIRSENGIERGKMQDGNLFEPAVEVTREKAAKTVYFMWVISNDVNDLNDLSHIN